MQSDRIAPLIGTAQRRQQDFPLDLICDARPYSCLDKGLIPGATRCCRKKAYAFLVEFLT